MNPLVPSIARLAVVPLGFAVPAAHAVQYMTFDEAQQLVFPKASFTGAQAPASSMVAVAARLGATPNASNWKVLRAEKEGAVQGYIVADAVLGKFQMIEYVVAFDAKGAIKDIEILAYREAHGGEVRTAQWRHQFVGLNASAPLQIGNDIANISGATLSCTHLTDGIRRIAAYVQLGIIGS
jgi:Na+-translocating ferredoxin:NAD+ oxidoreductase RnfG subunit